MFLFRDKTSIEVIFGVITCWASNKGQETEQETDNVFLHNSQHNGGVPPPPPRTAKSICVFCLFRWVHTWTASEPHAGVCRWKTHQQFRLSGTGRWCSAGQHNTYSRMHRKPDGRGGTKRQVGWTKDQLVVKLEQPAFGPAGKVRQEWFRNVYSPQQTRAWIMH